MYHNSILYITSCSKELVQIYGCELIHSFLRHGVEGNFLITHENGIMQKLKDQINKHKFLNNVALYDLANDEFLQTWLQANKDIIPKQLGGIAPKCKCKKNKRHKKGCVFSFFNSRASQWFRKIVSLKYGLENSQARYIVFVDWDVVFKQTLLQQTVQDVFKDNGVFYHLGPYRIGGDNGVESGFIGFDRQQGGEEFLNEVIDLYSSDKFRQYDRWDDGYIIRMVIENHTKVKCRDVVGPHKRILKDHVIPIGPFKDYLDHHKGQLVQKYKSVS